MNKKDFDLIWSGLLIGISIMGLICVVFLNIFAEDTTYYKDGYQDAMNQSIDCYNLVNGSLYTIQVIPYNETYTCEDGGLYIPEVFWDSVTIQPRQNEERSKDEQ